MISLRRLTLTPSILAALLVLQAVAKAQPATSKPDSAAELARFDSPQKYLPATGPASTEFDAAYRSFIQTDESAASKGLPSHAEAARIIKTDVAKDPANLEKHKAWVLFVAHHSRAYRPEAATADLRKLYADLVGGQPRVAAKMPTLPFEGDPRLTIVRDVVYGQSHPAIQKLDAYLIKSPRPTPVLLEIHGGGWRRGQKSQFIYAGNLMEQVIAAGISIISIDYRLTPDYVFPSQMADVARAVQFIRSNAREWNLRPDGIVAIGGSAGAHLSAWLALHDDMGQPASTDPIERQSTRLTAFITLAGPMDLTRVRPTILARQPLRGEDFANAFVAAFGCSWNDYEQNEAIRKRVHDASPLFLVTPDDPPALVIAAASEEMTAERHAEVPEMINDPHSAWQMVLLADTMHKAGIPVQCRIGPRVGKDPAADSAAVLQFLKEKLGIAP